MLVLTTYRALPACLPFVECIPDADSHLCVLQDSLALRMPAAVRPTDREACSADQLILEFWQGTTPVGMCRLPIKAIREKMMSQARGFV